MPRVFAAHSLFRADRGRAELDRWTGQAHLDAPPAERNFTLARIAFRLGGSLPGQHRWFLDMRRSAGMRRIAAYPRRPEFEWRRPPVDGLHRTDTDGCESQRRAGLQGGFSGGEGFSRMMEEFGGNSLSRFSSTADSNYMALPIPRRSNGRTRGLNTCR